MSNLLPVDRRRRPARRPPAAARRQVLRMADYAHQAPPANDCMQRICIGLHIALDACAGLLCQENEGALGALDDTDIEGSAYMMQLTLSAIEGHILPPLPQVRKALDCKCPSARALADFILSHSKT